MTNIILNLIFSLCVFKLQSCRVGLLVACILVCFTFSRSPRVSYFQICELGFQKLIYIQFDCTFVTLTNSSSQPDQQFPWHYLTPLTLTPLMMWTKETTVENQVECNCLFKFIDKTLIAIPILISLPFVFCVFYNSAPISSWRSSIHTHTAIVSHFLGLLSWGLLKPSSLNHEITKENSLLLKMCLLKLKN